MPRMTPSHPTYCEQIDGLLQEVQHMRLGVVDARNVFLNLMDQAVIESLEQFMKDSAAMASVNIPTTRDLVSHDASRNGAA